MTASPFSRPVTPDWQAFIDCVCRRGTPARVHNAELFLDAEVEQAICDRFDLLGSTRRDDPFYAEQRRVAVQRFLGYDYVEANLEGMDLPLDYLRAEDTAGLTRTGGREYVNEHSGPIPSWQAFEAYPWPDPAQATTRALEWYTRNLPDDMCIIGGLTGHFFENLSFLMGYETLCLALYEQRDLVEAIARRCLEIDRQVTARLLEFDRVRAIWASDDLGFRSGTLVSPRDLRALVLPAHKQLAQLTHAAGRLYFLHSCGKLSAIMDDLLDDVQIDAQHSFEDTILDVRQAKLQYGARVALLGGIDMDFLCRSDPEAIRQRVRDTLSVCQPGGGYCLGTGNTVANYVPVDNYLAMLDEGRRFG
jgi:uroporphyrinogen decarboxylase